MKNIVTILILVALSLTACIKNEVAQPVLEKDVFTASLENFDTKTSMASGKHVVWSKGDKLAIFQSSTLADEYQVNEASIGKTNATFDIVKDDVELNGSFSAGTEMPCNVAFYPYVDDLTLALADFENEDYVFEIMGAVLPAIQDYSTGSFGECSFPMVAVTNDLSDRDLKFRNLLGAMRLQFKGSQKVMTIKVEGKNNERLAGDATITAYAGNFAPTLTMADDAGKSITLDCGDGVQLYETIATDFIIALPPMLFSRGFVVTVTDSHDEITIIETDVANTVLRSSILVMPPITVAGTEGDEDDEIDTEKIPVGKLTLSSTSLKLFESDVVQLSAVVLPIDATDKEVTWSSDDPSVATVTQDGVVTAVQTGTTMIYAVADGVIANCSVSVKAFIDYVDEYNKNFGKGVAVGSTIWAPVNCGYKATIFDDNGDVTDKGYPYGKLYQWGRRYGQGYDENDASVPTMSPGGVSLQGGQSAANENVFFLGSSDADFNWLYIENNYLWNSGTESYPIKGTYDPCPDGWRLPTYIEIRELERNHSSWMTNEDGQNGYWFSGPISYSEQVPQIFLSAAGTRDREGKAINRGTSGDYWSSKPEASIGYTLSFSNNGFSDTFDLPRATAMSVRCVQE